jgi:DNA repair protein RecO (recombination protein O)
MRVNHQPAYVLHHYGYRETSLLLEVFTRNYGRLALLAKGVRRMRPRGRMVLEPFQPLLLSWAGKGELPVLAGAEPDGEVRFLSGTALYCAFYMSELLLRLLHRHDPHEALFDVYRTALQALRQDPSLEPTLRLFEKQLLQAIGYGLVLDHEMPDNAPVDANLAYRYVINRGPIRVLETASEKSKQAIVIHGSSLLALASETLRDPVALQEVKVLLRAAIDHQLGGRPLNTRRLFHSIRQAPLVGGDGGPLA